MKIADEKAGAVLILKPDGRLDHEAARPLETAISRFVEDGETSILIELAEVNYVSSAGLRAILIGAKQIQGAGGKLALCSLSEHVREVFDLSGFSTILDIRDDRDAALAALV